MATQQALNLLFFVRVEDDLPLLQMYKDRQVRLEYHKQYNKRWYKKNKKSRSQQIYKRKRDLRKWIADYKSTLKCSLCPEKHVATLDFHHIDPSKKDLSLANAMNCGWSKKRLMKEIEKCQVLCSNCHRKLHWNDA